ncbi:transmembrane emp24 domain-containing protein 11 [Manis pentadactyla]|uniref:transmembrane emp24 domain-containing protein 11 n=1 Tax=Manis pentadactyla TaxID=143292 RepID=UPI00255CBE2A|nr:transmembrane emp24 domain-containing protein 11 [Manis pentadactyla]
MLLLTEIDLQSHAGKHTASPATLSPPTSRRDLPGAAVAATEMRVLTLLSLCFSPLAAFYFHAGEREERCILKDVPSDTLVTGTFKIQQWNIGRQDFLESAPGLGMFVTVTTYNDEVLLSKLYGSRGTFYFTSHSPGEHVICLESNSTRLVSFGGSELRIHLEIRVGEHDLDAAIAQAKDKVNEVSFKLEHLIEQIEQIVKEQNYQRDREENFRMTSEDTNSNVLWWAFAQTLIFISIGIFQMKYLKDFFIAKKLV